MNETRRQFLKKAALAGGTAAMWQLLPTSIAKALAINPNPGTTFEDAEHVVMLMQENRSFDHCFGTLRGVRGFADPRAINIPGKFPVWMQPDKKGTRFTPFRLDMHNSKATWMSSIPHSWTDQVDAFNKGKYDGWIEAKRPGNPAYKQFPFTMGYYTRQDIPFYYELADAFTVFDQHYCAALTGTTTNRSYFWTGKTQENKNTKAYVRNGELTYSKEGDWATFPERLEQLGISWKVYQNEVSLPTLVEDSSLLANFTDNNLEWFKKYHVRFNPSYYEYLVKRKKDLEQELGEIERKGVPANADEKFLKDLERKKEELPRVIQHLKEYHPSNFEKLPEFEKNLHKKAFTINSNDPDFHKIEKFKYTENGEEREVAVPKGDIFHQFRSDVNNGKLPAVSWLVAPQKFSDHPSAPWYGAWYLSEVMDILTQNPEVWKKTIFILNYDENDGYFDHIPPFVVPKPGTKTEGVISDGLDTTGEYVTKEEELAAGFSEKDSRDSAVGLGFRVPLIVASPWSRGGWVNSQVSDITSTIQFLEKFLTKKTGKNVKETNISTWRRNVSGDLTSAFRPYNGEPLTRLKPVERNAFMQGIHQAQFKEVPNNFRSFTPAEASSWTEKRLKEAQVLPAQESGTKNSNALNYDIRVAGKLVGKKFELRMTASTELFGKDAWGVPLMVYAPGNYKNEQTGAVESARAWNFAIKPGDTLTFEWPLENFENNQYHLRVYGPNGFYIEYSGTSQSEGLELTFTPNFKRKGKRVGLVSYKGKQAAQLAENSYRKTQKSLKAKDTFNLDAESTKGWYDFTVKGEGFAWSFAGRLENGEHSISDPLLG